MFPRLALLAACLLCAVLASGCSAPRPDPAVGLAAAPACRVEASRGMAVLGQVNRPSGFAPGSTLTLTQAIELAGGFNVLSWRSGVTVRRCRQIFRFDVDAILEGTMQDPSLEDGDIVMVPFRD